MDNLNTQPPFFGKQQPLYPHLLQLLRVTSATVPGPQGYASASAIAAALYVSFTEQLRTDNLLPRDREPCLVDDVNFTITSPGYYLGRLAGQWTGLPVYEVVCCLPPGVTAAQWLQLISVLTPPQLAKLNNLSPCQLQVFMQLNASQQQVLSGSLTPTQLTNLVGTLQPAQLQNLVSSTTPAQDLILTSAYPNLYQTLFEALPPQVINTIAQNLTGTQVNTLVALTQPQLSTLFQLPITQIQTLLNSLSSVQLAALTSTLTSTQLGIVVNSLSVSQLQKLVNSLTAGQVQTLVQGLTAQQNLTSGQISTQLTTIVGNLNSSQLSALTNYPPATITALVNTLTTASSGGGSTAITNLAALLNKVPVAPDPILGNQAQFPYIPSIVGTPSSTPLSAPGYTSVVTANGLLYGYVNGVWTPLGGSSVPTSIPAANWITFTLNYSDFVRPGSSTDSNWLAVYTLPAGQVIERTKTEVTIQFQNPGLDGWFIQVGSNAASADILQSSLISDITNPFSITTSSFAFDAAVGTTVIYARLHSDTGDVSTITQGQLKLKFYVNNPGW